MAAYMGSSFTGGLPAVATAATTRHAQNRRGEQRGLPRLAHYPIPRNDTIECLTLAGPRQLQLGDNRWRYGAAERRKPGTRMLLLRLLILNPCVCGRAAFCEPKKALSVLTPVGSFQAANRMLGVGAGIRTHPTEKGIEILNSVDGTRDETEIQWIAPDMRPKS